MGLSGQQVSHRVLQEEPWQINEQSVLIESYIYIFAHEILERIDHLELPFINS